MRDLVAHQRVSKKWKAAILGWSELQKALFFQPVEDLQLSLVEDSVAPAGGLRPLKCTSQRKCPRDLAGYPVGDDWYYPSFDDVPRGITRWAVDRSDEREYRIVINPLLGVEKPWDQIYFEDDERGKDKFRREAYKRREASWRYMFFSQPPLKEALVSHQGTAHFHVIRAKDRSKGLTLGDVHDSKRAFKASIQSVWGEDGFSPGVPEDSSACDVLEKLGLDPAPEKHDEASAD